LIVACLSLLIAQRKRKEYNIKITKKKIKVKILFKATRTSSAITTTKKEEEEKKTLSKVIETKKKNQLFIEIHRHKQNK
jgi:hypothetical protein